MEAVDARPVLSFLYRTCQFAVMGHRRKARPEAEMREAEAPSAGPDALLRKSEAGRCLELARRLLREPELDVLLAKLAGVPAREIARALGVSESVVDHRFRGALARLRARLCRKPACRRGRHA